MTERSPMAAAGRPPPRAAERGDDAVAQDAERALGRFVAVGLPIACAAGAITVGLAAGIGSALLVTASGALLGTIALIWASLRTLSGDAPLPLELEGASMRRADVDGLAERKRRVLRALKDLDAEHAVGKIDDADYEAFVARYREEAKAVMREMDRDAAPARIEAERVASEYLAKKGLLPPSTPGSTSAATPDRPPAGATDTPARAGAEDGRVIRVACPGCGVSNEPDASFCKRCGGSLMRERHPDEKL